MNPDPASLDRLHDIVAAPPVPWWPPAPAWYWVIGFLLVVVLVLVLKSLIRWQHNRYRREALAELARQQSALEDPNRRAAVMGSLAELLKRTALSAWPRETVASLTGPSWFGFLDRSLPMGSGSRLGEQLEKISYDPRAANSVDDTQTRELVGLVGDWIRNHRTNNPRRSRSRPRPRIGDEKSTTRTRDEDEDEGEREN